MKLYFAVPIQAQNAIDAHLRDREGELVCIGNAVLAVRGAISCCKLSDRELGDAIAAVAISSGNPIFFDGVEPDGPDREGAREDAGGPHKKDSHRAGMQMSDMWPLR